MVVDDVSHIHGVMRNAPKFSGKYSEKLFKNNNGKNTSVKQSFLPQIYRCSAPSRAREILSQFTGASLCPQIYTKYYTKISKNDLLPIQYLWGILNYLVLRSCYEGKY
jgi:hypothetical protein